MSKFKKIIALISVMCLLSASTYAETIANNKNISVAEENTTENNDFSETLINAIKYSNGEEIIIYSGNLGGYENGAFSHVDFSKARFMIVFDWDGMADDATYIIPVTTQVTKKSTQDDIHLKSSSDVNTLSTDNTFSSVAIKTNISLMYNDQYCENVLLPGQTLNVPVSIENPGESTLEVIPYIAKYGLSGILLDVKECEKINALPNQTTKQTLSIDFDNDAAYTAKIFLWQKDTIMPITKSVYLTIENQDYYADTFEQAGEVDVSKQLCGVINTNSDIDIVKITPTATGIYALQFEAATDTVCGLYDSSKALLNSISAVPDKNYLLYSLNADEDYYICFSGNVNSNYKIVPAFQGELTDIIQNIGTEDTISNSTDLNIYKFIPQTTNEYIITAVDGTEVTAILYSSDFEKIAVSNNNDSTISFRITADMTENQTYYIAVYPKSEKIGSYTMYVEEPFNVVAVQ